MGQQLGLDLEPEPKRRRAVAPEAFYVRGQVTPAELTQGERHAAKQNARVLAIFRALPGKRLTPSQVLDFLRAEGREVPLLTSVRRALSTMTKRGLLVHDAADRRLGPRGARESVWRLA